MLRISDFGLTNALRETTQPETPTEGFTGTVRYASPEQASGQKLNGSSDIYSLSIIFVEAVTGHVPFLTDSLAGTLKARIGKSVHPESLGPLGPVVQQAGMTDSSNRPTAERVRRMLLEVAPSLPRPTALPLVGPGEIGAAPLSGEVTTVMPQKEEMFKEPRRIRSVGPKRRWPAVAAAALLLAGAITGGIFLWQTHTSRRNSGSFSCRSTNRRNC